MPTTWGTRAWLVSIILAVNQVNGQGLSFNSDMSSLLESTLNLELQANSSNSILLNSPSSSPNSINPVYVKYPLLNSTMTRLSDSLEAVESSTITSQGLSRHNATEIPEVDPILTMNSNLTQTLWISRPLLDTAADTHITPETSEDSDLTATVWVSKVSSDLAPSTFSAVTQTLWVSKTVPSLPTGTLIFPYASLNTTINFNLTQTGLIPKSRPVVFNSTRTMPVNGSMPYLTRIPEISGTRSPLNASNTLLPFNSSFVNSTITAWITGSIPFPNVTAIVSSIQTSNYNQTILPTFSSWNASSASSSVPNYVTNATMGHFSIYSTLFPSPMLNMTGPFGNTTIEHPTFMNKTTQLFSDKESITSRAIPTTVLYSNNTIVSLSSDSLNDIGTTQYLNVSLSHTTSGYYANFTTMNSGLGSNLTLSLTSHTEVTPTFSTLSAWQNNTSKDTTESDTTQLSFDSTITSGYYSNFTIPSATSGLGSNLTFSLTSNTEVTPTISTLSEWKNNTSNDIIENSTSIMNQTLSSIITSGYANFTTQWPTSDLGSNLTISLTSNTGVITSFSTLSAWQNNTSKDTVENITTQPPYPTVTSGYHNSSNAVSTIQTMLNQTKTTAYITSSSFMTNSYTQSSLSGFGSNSSYDSSTGIYNITMTSMTSSISTGYETNIIPGQPYTTTGVLTLPYTVTSTRTVPHYTTEVVEYTSFSTGTAYATVPLSQGHETSTALSTYFSAVSTEVLTETSGTLTFTSTRTHTSPYTVTSTYTQSQPQYSTSYATGTQYITVTQGESTVLVTSLHTEPVFITSTYTMPSVTTEYVESTSYSTGTAYVTITHGATTTTSAMVYTLSKPQDILMSYSTSTVYFTYTTGGTITSGPLEVLSTSLLTSTYTRPHFTTQYVEYTSYSATTQQITLAGTTTTVASVHSSPVVVTSTYTQPHFTTKVVSHTSYSTVFEYVTESLGGLSSVITSSYAVPGVTSSFVIEPLTTTVFTSYLESTGYATLKVDESIKTTVHTLPVFITSTFTSPANTTVYVQFTEYQTGTTYTTMTIGATEATSTSIITVPQVLTPSISGPSSSVVTEFVTLTYGGSVEIRPTESAIPVIVISTKTINTSLVELTSYSVSTEIYTTTVSPLTSISTSVFTTSYVVTPSVGYSSTPAQTSLADEDKFYTTVTVFTTPVIRTSVVTHPHYSTEVSETTLYSTIIESITITPLSTEYIVTGTRTILSMVTLTTTESNSDAPAVTSTISESAGLFPTTDIPTGHFPSEVITDTIVGDITSVSTDIPTGMPSESTLSSGPSYTSTTITVTVNPSSSGVNTGLTSIGASDTVVGVLTSTASDIPTGHFSSQITSSSKSSNEDATITVTIPPSTSVPISQVSSEIPQSSDSSNETTTLTITVYPSISDASSTHISNISSDIVSNTVDEISTGTASDVPAGMSSGSRHSSGPSYTSTTITVTVNPSTSRVLTSVVSSRVVSESVVDIASSSALSSNIPGGHFASEMAQSSKSQSEVTTFTITGTTSNGATSSSHISSNMLSDSIVGDSTSTSTDIPAGMSSDSDNSSQAGYTSTTITITANPSISEAHTGIISSGVVSDSGVSFTTSLSAGNDILSGHFSSQIVYSSDSIEKASIIPATSSGVTVDHLSSGIAHSSGSSIKFKTVSITICRPTSSAITSQVTDSAAGGSISGPSVSPVSSILSDHFSSETLPSYESLSKLPTVSVTVTSTYSDLHTSSVSSKFVSSSPAGVATTAASSNDVPMNDKTGLTSSITTLSDFDFSTVILSTTITLHLPSSASSLADGHLSSPDVSKTSEHTNTYIDGIAMTPDSSFATATHIESTGNIPIDTLVQQTTSAQPFDTTGMATESQGTEFDTQTRTISIIESLTELYDVVATSTQTLHSHSQPLPAKKPTYTSTSIFVPGFETTSTMPSSVEVSASACTGTTCRPAVSAVQSSCQGSGCQNNEVPPLAQGASPKMLASLLVPVSVFFLTILHIV